MELDLSDILGSNEENGQGTQEAPVSNDSVTAPAPASTGNTIAMERNSFSKLLNTLKLIENYCTDCEISNGMIRQKTDDRQAIIEIDLTSIMDRNRLEFSLLKQKTHLLKSFELDENVTVDDQNMIIESTNTHYKFTDPLSNISFMKPMAQYSDNPFMPDDEIGRIINCSEENQVFSIVVNNYMTKRIKTICEGFSNEAMRCDLDGTNAKLSLFTTNYQNTADVVKNISLNMNIEPSAYFRVMTLAFFLDINSDVQFDVYRKSDTIYLCRFKQAFYEIPITIYTQVQISRD